MNDMSADRKNSTTWKPGPDHQKLHRRFPTALYLRRAAPRNIPAFAFEYCDTGAGADRGIMENWAALDQIKLVPRYGQTQIAPTLETELFGTRYAAPIGIAPMGGGAIVWPGADLLMAKAAQAARIPYTLGVVGGASIEDVAEVAPDVFWLQLYSFPAEDHRIGFDLVRRAQQAGARVLVLTLDVPVRTTRSRETYAGLAGEFRPGARMIWEMGIRPGWLVALLRHGYPRFANIRPYAGRNPTTNEVLRFARGQMRGSFSWDDVARYRDRWQGPLAVKGILHPADAEKAISLGVDGIWVSNHGGRQLEALPPAINVLPAIRAAAGGRATILYDSGLRSGEDVMRALALGAEAAFAGKSFLWALGALGEKGPAYLIDLYIEELRASLSQVGAATPAAAGLADIRHPGA